MAFKNTLTTYGSVTKFFHWLIFLLLLFLVILGFSLDSIPKDYEPLAYNIHKLTGVLVLILMSLRAIWALNNVKPLLPFNTPNWQRVAERVVHIFLYAVVIAMPITGLVGSVAAGHPPHLGSLVITLPIAENKVLAKAAIGMHKTLVLFLIALVTVHVCAALYHEFIKKDNVLRRMLPGRMN